MVACDEGELNAMSRKNLQALAKENGVKANMKSVAIVQELLKLWENHNDELIHEEAEKNHSQVAGNEIELELEHPILQRATIQKAKRQPPKENKGVRPVAMVEQRNTKSAMKDKSARKRRRTVDKENETSAKKGRFDAAHKKLFSQQKSILDEMSERKKRSSQLNTAKKPTIDNLRSAGKAKKRPVFDLQESLKRPITWKMKTGPFKP